MNQKNKMRKAVVQFRQWSNKRYAAFNSMRRVIKVCTLALAYSLVTKPTAVKAEGADTLQLKSQEIDDVVIQSTLIELKNAETGRSIEVIQGSQFQSLPVTSIDELLRYIPGVDAQQRGAFGTQTDFSLRGSNFNQVLVLIDGQKINDPLTAHFNSNIPISPSEIERIEIIRGAASAEYGPDATGGIINIITKTFSNSLNNKPLQADAKIQAGQYKLINANGGFYYSAKKYSISGGGIYSKSDGNTLESGIKNHFDINSTSLSARYRFTEKLSASYRFSRDYRDFNAQWFYTTSPFDKATEKVTRYRHQVLVENNGKTFNTQLLASNVKTNDYYVFMPNYAPNDNNSSLNTLQLRQSVHLTSDFIALYGIGYENKGVKSNDRGNHNLQHFGSFVTSSYNGIKDLTINAGLRGDYDKTFGFFLLPQAGISYKIINSVIVRGSIGRSVRTPDFTELYTNNFRKDSLNRLTAIGFPGLKPEKSLNSELGVDVKPFSQLLISVTGFNRKAEGIIDYVSTPDSMVDVKNVKLKKGNFWFAQNNSTTKTNGIETRISYGVNINNNVNLRLLAGYTYLNIGSTFNKESRYALLQPKHLINGNLQINIGPVEWNIDGLYKVRNSIPSAASINRSLKTSYTVWNSSINVAVYKKLVFVSLDIYNAFDTKYSDFLGAEMPGRWISGGAKFSF